MFILTPSNLSSQSLIVESLGVTNDLHRIRGLQTFLQFVPMDIKRMYAVQSLERCIVGMVRVSRESCHGESKEFVEKYVKAKERVCRDPHQDKVDTT